jgi:hypothetical protein
MAGTDPARFDDPREAELAARGLALVHAAVGATSAPLALREQIERDRERARPAAGRRRLLGVLAAVGTVAAAAIAALVISLGGSSATPSVLATIRLAGAGPVLPAPKTDAQNPRQLRTQIAGLPFPTWKQFRWRASGARTDRIDGRHATTVYYDLPIGATAAYTILDGDAIPPPDGAKTVRLGGRSFHLLTQDGKRVIVWTRDGHTCVMSAPPAVPDARLVQLASLDNGGR